MFKLQTIKPCPSLTTHDENSGGIVWDYIFLLEMSKFANGSILVIDLRLCLVLQDTSAHISLKLRFMAGVVCSVNRIYGLLHAVNYQTKLRWSGERRPAFSLEVNKNNLIVGLYVYNEGDKHELPQLQLHLNIRFTHLLVTLNSCGLRLFAYLHCHLFTIKLVTLLWWIITETYCSDCSSKEVI